MAHRGDQSAAPENTILALKSAVSLGADVLETDVRMTRDGQLVLFHDETLERTTDGKGKVSEFTLDELQQLDFGFNFTPDGGKTYPFRDMGLTVVTLEEALSKFPNVAFNLDIKDTDPQAPELLARLLREYDREESVIVASFHPRQIERFRQILPTVKTAAHPMEVRRFIMLQRLRIPTILVPRMNVFAFQVPLAYNGQQIVTKRFIERAHRKGIQVHVWTINERSTMEQLITMGVDGIFTDKPSLLVDVLRDRGLM